MLTIFASAVFYLCSPQESRPESAPASRPAPTVAELTAAGIQQILAGEDNGCWSYEGVYRTPDGNIPLGYRVGGTAIVCTTLLYYSNEKDDKINAAIGRGVDFILKNLGDPLLEPSTVDAYDVRIWGQSCALDLFAHLKLKKRLGARAKDIQEWMPKLIKTIVTEEIEGGGWNYAQRKASSTFVTSPVAQTLLYARAAGESVPDAVLTRAREFLERCRLESGAFVYDERVLKSAKGKMTLKAIEQVDRTARLPGAVGRAPVSEATIALLGKGDLTKIEKAIHDFYEHWGELEKRRKKTGTHVGDYGIAPYYFYYAHRFVAQAIEMLPSEKRAAERAKLLEFILKTRDEDGTWNDRHFPRSRCYSTAMVLLALLGEKQPMPPAFGASKNMKK